MINNFVTETLEHVDGRKIKMLGHGALIEQKGYMSTLEVFMGFSEDRDWDHDCEALRKFCDQYNVYYYAAPREDFSIMFGLEEAFDAGADYILAEDLS